MKHIIWTNNIDIDDWGDNIKELFPNVELTEDEIYYYAYRENDENLACEKENLNKDLNGTIVIFRKIKRWDGKYFGIKFIEDANLNDIFSETCGDYVTWYVEDGEIMCEDCHHDGTNYYTYRLLKDEFSRFDFEEYSYDHSLKETLEKMTEPMGHFVSEIYGFKENKNETVLH